MTQLCELYNENREEALDRIRSMDVALLFAELDDTLQLDVLKASCMDWAAMPNMKLYRAILTEIRRRCQ